MIKKSVVTAFIIFGIYSAFIYFNKRDWSHAQYNYQENIIKAEKYLYGSQNAEATILGTSLGARVITDSLPGFYNMAMYGMGVFDGANVLLKKKKLSPYVFIEVNYFYKVENEDYKNLFSSNTVDFLKQSIPALRDENQPIGTSYGAIRGGFNLNNKAPAAIPLEQDFFNSLLANATKQYSNPDTALINKGIAKLKILVSALTAKGVKVCFFEMPVNYKLTELPLSQMVRKAINKNFPGYIFIPIPSNKYTSSDGVHLGKVEALEYTNYFKINTREIVKNN